MATNLHYFGDTWHDFKMENACPFTFKYSDILRQIF